MPPLRADPGTTAGYSNYATALAGYIVQRVSGEQYEDYIEHHIFQPLGMAHSTFRQPLPTALAPLMAQGYMETGQPGHGFEVVNLPPAGSLSSTADDMSRFMIAHLQDGSLGDARESCRPRPRRRCTRRRHACSPTSMASRSASTSRTSTATA